MLIKQSYNYNLYISHLINKETHPYSRVDGYSMDMYLCRCPC